jgi:uncharacterized protein (DUF4415 family)
MVIRKKTKKEEERIDAEIELELALHRIDMEVTDLERYNRLRKGCPPGWRRVEDENPTRPRKVHVTLRIDKDVATWFWRQGEGYQARMNAVLRAYMLAKKVEIA